MLVSGRQSYFGVLGKNPLPGIKQPNIKTQRFMKRCVSYN